MLKTGICAYLMIFIVSISYGQKVATSEISYNLKEIDSVISGRWKTQVSTTKELKRPYINALPGLPCMFYWDTYFINKGLIATKHVAIAKNNTINILDIINRFGFMGNAAVISWGMNRSQPPYISMMVRDIYSVDKDLNFLKYAYPILKKEHHFWTMTGEGNIEDHSTSIPGLQRYSHHANKKELVDLYNEIAGRVNLSPDLADEQKSAIASDYAAEAESGMDFTPRFENKCTAFIPVDLNCLLYALELNLDWIEKKLKIANPESWLKKAEQRRDLINKYCWDEQQGLYYDYNYQSGHKSKVAAVTTLQPLLVGLASPKQAKKVIANLDRFETKYGLTTTENRKDDRTYQWGSKSIWAPLQLIAVDGLYRYGYREQARRVAFKFMNLVAKNYYAPIPSTVDMKTLREPGLTYEKYKSDGSINDDEYTGNAMMGWTAGVYNYLYKLFENR